MAPAPRHLLRIRRRGKLGPRSTSPAVLSVADLLHPIDTLAIERLLDRDVRQRRGWCCAMPVLEARREPHDVAWPHLFDRPAIALHPAETRYDDQGLAERMRVPGGSRAGF